MKNITNQALAIIGICIWVLSYITSAEVEGRLLFPVLSIVVGISYAIFMIMVSIRLWKRSKSVVLWYIFSFISALIMVILTVYVPSATIRIVSAIVSMACLVTFICITVQLFKKQEVSNSETRNTTDIIEASILNKGGLKERVKDFFFSAVYIMVMITLGFGWILNLYKLAHLDFKQPFKAEFVRIIGLSPLGTIIGYMDISDN